MSSVVQANILMVDDSPEKLLAHESVLASLNQPILKAFSGEEALRILLKHDIAVILLDVNMPGLNGFETAALIRQRKALERVPIIFITAMSTTDADLFTGYSLGAVDYILTPIIPEVLRTKVGVFVELQKQKAALERQAQSLQELNTDLRKRADALAEANRQMEAFSYSIAHDLRAPLRAIEGMTNALVEDYVSKLDESAQDYGKRIQSAARRMDRMIQELLGYSRLTLAQLHLTPVRIDVVLKDALAQLEQDLHERQVEIKCKNCKFEVLAQPDVLAQVFSNLISNAIKFVPPGARPRVKIWCEPKQGLIRCWVQDNGIGIAEEHLQRIFRVFERLHNTDAYPGTGIGLAIVKKGVERLGGEIGVQSTPGEGSRFWVQLPGVAPAKPESAPA